MAIIVEALNCGQFRFLIQQGFHGAELQDQTQASIKKHRDACSSCSQFHNHLVGLVFAAHSMNTPSETQLAEFEGVVQQIFEDLDDDSRRGFIEILCNLFPLGKLLLALQLAVDGRDPDEAHDVTMTLRAPANGHSPEVELPPTVQQPPVQPPVQQSVETPSSSFPHFAELPAQTQMPAQAQAKAPVPAQSKTNSKRLVAAPQQLPTQQARPAPPVPVQGQVPGQTQQVQPAPTATSVMTPDSPSVAYQIEPPSKPDFDEMPPQLNFDRSGASRPTETAAEKDDPKDSGSRRKLFSFDDQDIDELFRRNLGLHEIQNYLSNAQPLPVPPMSELTDFEAYAQEGMLMAPPQLMPPPKPVAPPLPSASPEKQAKPAPAVQQPEEEEFQLPPHILQRPSVMPSQQQVEAATPEPPHQQQALPVADAPQEEAPPAHFPPPESQPPEPEQTEVPQSADEPDLKPSPPVLKPSPVEPPRPPSYKEKLGRLDASKVDSSNENESIGTIRSVGKFLFDPHDVELFQNMITRSESRQNVREVTVEAAQAVDKLMEFIGSQPGVVGSLMLGADGSIVAHRVPKPYDVDSVAIWSLCAYLNSSNATKMMGHNSVKQIISQTHAGYVIIVNFHGGILVTIVDGGTTNSLVGLMRVISKLTE